MFIHSRNLGADVVLAPLGDVQVGAPYAEDTCKRYIDKAMKANAWFIGMGDYVDVTNPSSRRALRSIRVADSLERALEEKASEHVSEFLELVKGTKGRWLGLLGGHHYFQFTDGSTSDTKISNVLECPFWSDSVIMRLWGGKYPCTLLAFHGEGSSSAPSGALKRLETVAGGFVADVFLMGHHHKLAVSKRDRVYNDGVQLRHTTQTIVCTGSFVKGYVAGKGTYVERKMLSPVTLGGALVRIVDGEVLVEI